MEDKIQTGLRIPESRYRDISTIAKDSGVSVNAMVLMLVELGMQVVSLGKEEARRVLLQNLKDNS